ncbi:MAG: Gfo/Idh/MocA family protein [Candidatus Hydrogenedentales bacterium]|jgi:predicted dehydrogenase
MTRKVSRRQFVQSGTLAAAGAVSALVSSRAAGANERIRLGFIGVANRGGQLLECTTPFEDAEVVALCDVYRPPIEKWAESVPNPVTLYSDYRRMIEREQLDAVVIATPDHWHALQTIDACEAGLDVYVEKPLSITIHEGRRMIEAVRRTNRVVQVGIQRRSCPTLAQARDFVGEDKIGPVVVGRCCRVSNMWPDGIGSPPDSDPPAGLDWDMWLGPRPFRPFNAAIAPYNFRWHKEYSSQLANWGVHYFDAFRMALDEDMPTSICAMGGRLLLDDARSIPDTMEVVFSFPSRRMLHFSQYETSSNALLRTGMVEFRGTIGTLYYQGANFEVVPEFGGQFHDREKRMEPVQFKGEVRDPTALHIRNFLDCIKSRATPTCSIEEGHKSTTLALLGNISFEIGERITWDPVAERVTNHEKANDLLHYEYREPWKLA